MWREFLVGSLVVGNMACEEKPAPPAKGPAAETPAKPAEATAEPAKAAEGRGHVVVTVRFDGDPPEMKMQNRSHDRWCQKIPTREETVLVAEDGTLRNAIVRIARGIDESEKTAPPAEPVVIDQRDCMFRPRVAVAIENQKVAIKNSDKTLHNVHGYRGEPARSIFNHAQLAGAKPLEKTFLDGGEIISIRCDIHPWMASYVAISTHPYWGITTGPGPVTLENVPPGKVTIQTWHEKYGFKTVETRVRAGQLSRVTATYRPEDAAQD